MDLIEAISENLATYTVTRRAAETYSAGIKVPGSESSFSISASIQPLEGRELQDFPEAQDGREIRVVFTATELRARGADGAGDRITIDGESWEVIRSQAWDAWGESFTRAYCSRRAVP